MSLTAVLIIGLVGWMLFMRLRPDSHGGCCGACHRGDQPPRTAVMAIADWLLAAGVWLVLGRGGPRARAGGCQVRRIRVRGGYQPAEIHVTAGVPVRLVFRRQEAIPCSERVVFPDLGISAALPASRDTTVELPAQEPGTHPFTCEMEMLHGRLIADPARPHARTGRRPGRAVAA